MEQFVLGIFQEHLAKFIIGFRKEQVNANLLNGKGEITNVELNCSFLNDEIMKVTPYIELESVHVSKLSFHVTSWTNLRQSPIRIEIEHVTANIIEPLHFLDRQHRRPPIQQLTRHELQQQIKNGTIPKPRSNSYNLLDRILDNLTVEVRSVHINFQPAGKLKTRRLGPWTPPAIRIQLFDVRLVSVNEYGNEATPDEIWNHNKSSTTNQFHPQHHPHHRRDGNFLIYKKLETEYKISLVLSQWNTTKKTTASTDASMSSYTDYNHTSCPKDQSNSPDLRNETEVNHNETVIPLVSSFTINDTTTTTTSATDFATTTTNTTTTNNNCTKIILQMIFQRRIKDGEYMAVQMDLILPIIHIILEENTIPQLIHFLMALSYLLLKDRAYTDPFHPNHHSTTTTNTTTTSSSSSSSPTIVSTNSHESIVSSSSDDGEPVSAPTMATSMMDFAMADGLSESSEDENDNDPDTLNEVEEDDDAVVIEVAASQQQQQQRQLKGRIPTDAVSFSLNETPNSTKPPPPVRPTRKPTPQTPVTPGPTPQSYNDRPVIVFPNALMFHEKVSFSISIHHATIRGIYMIPMDGEIQIVANGIVVEAIWPQITKEKGGYLQSSVSYVAIQERHKKKIRPLLVGGAQYDNTGPLEQPTIPLAEVDRDNTFPLYEDRSIRPDPIGLRYAFPMQALGYKLTISHHTKLGADPEETSTETLVFLNEIGVDRFDVTLDSMAWCRFVRFAMNIGGSGIDPRWHSGDWSSRLRTDMLLHPSVPLNLDDHIQPNKPIFLDENQFPSSDLFNATVRITKSALTIPATVIEDVRSCDVHIEANEIMIVVSSALPRSLLNSSNNTDAIRFPHDPSDVAYLLEKSEDPANRQRGITTSRGISTFRSQLTFRGLSVRLSPIIPTSKLRYSEQFLLPSELTMISCFEGDEPLMDDNKEALSDQIRVVLFVSVIAHRFEMNIDFDLIASALATILVHTEHLVKTGQEYLDLAGKRPDASESEIADLSESGMCDDGRIESSLQGRRVLVRRQILRSRETGGLSVALSLQVVETRFLLWRQHVMQSSSHVPMGNCIPLLCLLDFAITKMDFGLEVSLRREERVTVIKCCVGELNVSICDLQAVGNRDLLSANDCPPSSEGETSTLECDYLVSIFVCKHSQEEKLAIAFRVQERQDNEQAWSLSFNLTDAIIYFRVDEIGMAVNLLSEALLMPTSWPPSLMSNNTLWFPTNSVGALFCSLLPRNWSTTDTTHTCETNCKPFSGESGHTTSEKSVHGLLQHIFARFIPASVDVFLLRFGLDNVLMRFTNESNCTPAKSKCETQNIGIKLCASEMYAGYFASENARQTKLLNVLARNDETWSVVCPEKSLGSLGFSQLLQSRQNIFSTEAGSRLDSIKSVVDEFDFVYSYSDSKVSFSIGDGVGVGDTEQFDLLLNHLSCFTKKLKNQISHVKKYLTFSRRANGGGYDTGKSNFLEDDPDAMSLACSSALASMQSARAWLCKANQDWNSYDNMTRSLLSLKDKKIAQLRLTVFAAEKARFNSLALVESQACGWLKLGASQITGQRGLMSSVLFPYWVILRRSFLILYAGPGQHNVAGIISLKAASIRELNGGHRKRDLKRSFVIVESNSIVHFVIAISEADYITWLQKIRRAIRFYSPNGGPDGSEVEILEAINNSARASLLENTDAKLDFLRSSSQGRPLSGSISRAVAKVRGMRSESLEVDTQTSAASADSSIDGMLPNISGSAEDCHSSNTSTESRSLNDHKHKLMLRKGLAGVGQATKRGLGSATNVTKNRFGAALQAAKLKGKAAVEKTRSRLQVERNEPQVGTVIVSNRWACSSCTFINDANTEKCQICNAICPHETSKKFSSQLVAEETSVPVLSKKATSNDATDQSIDSSYNGLTNNQTISDVDYNQKAFPELSALQEEEVGIQCIDLVSEIHNDDDLSVSGKSESLAGDDISIYSDQIDEDARERGTSQLGMKQRFGAVVRRAKSMRLDQKVPLGAPESVRLRNVTVGRALPTPLHPFGKENDTIDNVTLKRLEGLWTVRVRMSPKPSLISNKATDEEDILRNNANSNNEADAADRQDDEHDATLSITASQAEVTLPMIITENPDKGSYPNSTSANDSSTENELIESTFEIEVYKHGEKIVAEKVGNVTKTIPELASLHTALSEAVSRVPFYKYDSDKGSDRSQSERMSRNVARELGLTTIDTVRLTGKLLGGIFENCTGSSAKDEPHFQYQAEAVSEFLNAVLDSLLPVDGLFLLTEFLQLTDASSNSSDSALIDSLQESAFYGEEEILLLSKKRDALLLPSLCEKQLLEAEKNCRLAQQLSGLSVLRRCDKCEDTFTDTQSNYQYFQPLFATSQFRDAMHSALVTVMEERDQAHARMLAAEVLHVHEIEQQRKTMIKVSTELNLMKKMTQNHVDQPTSGIDDGSESLRNVQRQNDSDAELISLCQQLSGEISARTLTSLEIIRIRESRMIEVQSEAIERKALVDEITQLRQQLAQERSYSNIIRREADSWKESFTKAFESSQASP